MSAYMRHQFPFLGVPTPARRAACRDILRGRRHAPDWELVSGCWAEPEREFQYVACDHLRQVPLCASDLPRLRELVTTKSWWDTVDALARPVGHATDAATMRAWARDGNLWVRRVAILHQLGHRGGTDTALLTEIILANPGSGEFFIDKAIGWALRDFARHDPEWVRGFLAEHGAELSALSRREAAKHL
ncbi:hypothetical protein A605_04780 [Corynebacterium halotolerans YIM 70093 = DSM 44683]|uniref:DNA alkylation repair enzyme n=2 Tax=Corynebacterium halotolerans TaxID=225326 RepID=M1MW67_9CORY|nr:hypothetical protein A605_04780 [Corynebacterium halotolerans YIM 70093 = DSM 44683]